LARSHPARAGLSNGFTKLLAQLLDALLFETLTQVAAHQATLASLGCQTLGQVKALPRVGLSRRFDAPLRGSRAQAYGLRPDGHEWAQLSNTYHAKLELMARVEHAPAIVFGARRLMLQMAGWLLARRSGVSALTSRWCHDAMRSKSAGDCVEMTVRTAHATSDTEHLTRLLARHSVKFELLEPVGDLGAVGQRGAVIGGKEPVYAARAKGWVRPWRSCSSATPHAWGRTRVAPGPGRKPPNGMNVSLATGDRRPAPDSAPRTGCRPLSVPQPTFVLAKPLRMAVQDNRPI